MRPINVRDRANALTEYFSPRVIGEVNDVYVKVARIKGDEIPWHNHPGEDEMFYVLEGSLLFEIEGEEPFTMERGDLFIVGRGVNHRVSSTGECSLLVAWTCRPLRRRRRTSGKRSPRSPGPSTSNSKDTSQTPRALGARPSRQLRAERSAFGSFWSCG